MTATYADVVEAMVEAEKRGLDREHVVLSEESMDTFLEDNNFSERDEQRQEETIGNEWKLPIKSGEEDYLMTTGGERIDL